MAILLKVYGHLYPTTAADEEALRAATSGAIADPVSADVPLIARTKDLLTISFEGIYFPLAEVMCALKALLRPEQTGKLDVLDVDAWSMCRYRFNKGHIEEHAADLNAVLDYSGF